MATRDSNEKDHVISYPLRILHVQALHVLDAYQIPSTGIRMATGVSIKNNRYIPYNIAIDDVELNMFRHYYKEMGHSRPPKSAIQCHPPA
jgi:hypothetical protein